jgi:hypothetical protein
VRTVLGPLGCRRGAPLASRFIRNERTEQSCHLKQEEGEEANRKRGVESWEELAKGVGDDNDDSDGGGGCGDGG